MSRAFTSRQGRVISSSQRIRSLLGECVGPHKCLLANAAADALGRFVDLQLTLCAGLGVFRISLSFLSSFSTLRGLAVQSRNSFSCLERVHTLPMDCLSLLAGVLRVEA